MADKILKSITFPNLPDKYIIPETTVDAVPTQGSTNAVSSGGVWEAVHDTDVTLNNVRERTNNILDCNSTNGWYPSTVGKDVTVSVPKSETIRVISNISQTYAGVRKNIDTTNINTLYAVESIQLAAMESRSRDLIVWTAAL